MEAAVAAVKKKHDIEVQIVRANEIPFFRRLFMPGFPAVAIDGRFVSKNRVLSPQELEAHIHRLKG